MDTNTPGAKMKMLNTPLAQSVADLAWNWVEQPWGEPCDNGFCDSEMYASELKDVLKAAIDDAGLVHGLYHYIAERERYDADSRSTTPVRQILEQHGYQVPPRAAKQVEDSKPARRGLMGMFRR